MIEDVATASDRGQAEEMVYAEVFVGGRMLLAVALFCCLLIKDVLTANR